MGEFHQVVLKTVAFTSRRLQRPAPTKFIVADVCVVIGERRMRDYLRELEMMGKVCRPAGPKSGWALVRAA